MGNIQSDASNFSAYFESNLQFIFRNNLDYVRYVSPDQGPARAHKLIFGCLGANKYESGPRPPEIE